MKLLMTLITLLFSINVNAQIHHGKYLVVSSIGDDKAPVPTELTIIYDVNSDDRYIEIKGSLNRMSASYTEEEEKGAHVIIDTKLGLVYYVNEKKLKKLAIYEIDKKNNIKSEIYTAKVSGKTCNIEMNKQWPKNMTPGILFNNTIHGITKVSSPKLNIKFIGKLKTSKGNLHSFEQYFKNFGKQNLEIVEMLL